MYSIFLNFLYGNIVKITGDFHNTDIFNKRVVSKYRDSPQQIRRGVEFNILTI